MGVLETRAARRVAAPWPYAHLDGSTARKAGWRPTQLRDVVLKVHQRCNLACDYCYVYTLADQSWRSRPTVMSDAVRRTTIDRLARYVQRHDLKQLRVILHGGEPLLFGRPALDRLADELRAGIPAGCRLDIGLQTNATLIDIDMIRMLRAQRIAVSVSLDGVAENHDLHRRTVGGKGSYEAVRRGLDLLRRPEFQDSYAGVLCVVDPDTDPIGCYEQLLSFTPPSIDFLLPHGNWGSAPPRPSGDETVYADWLCAIFDRWYDGDDRVAVHLFDNLISLILGGPGRSEQLGLSPAALVVIETDGAIEQVDALKSAYPGAAATGLNILVDDLDAVFEDPGVIARQLGLAALCEECAACPVHRVCGAGHYAHRFRPGEGFRNPSVYCADLLALIGHVRGRLAADVARILGPAG